jgi:hypothetical protein
MSPLVMCSAATNKMSPQKKTCEGGNLAIYLPLLFTLMQGQKALFIACQWLIIIQFRAAKKKR